MVLESNLNARIFLAEVAHRLHHVWIFLRDFRVGRRSNVVIPLWSVHALRNECRQLGHSDLADQCACLERAIMELHLRNNADNERPMAEIRRACRYITKCARADVHGVSVLTGKTVTRVDVDAA